MNDCEMLDEECIISYHPQHPLPEEIQNMKRDDTVCQYCGVSYLIHNEIKKLEEKLVKYKSEIERLKAFDNHEKDLTEQIQKLNVVFEDTQQKWKEESERATLLLEEVKQKDDQINELTQKVESLSNINDVLTKEKGSSKSMLLQLVKKIKILHTKYEGVSHMHKQLMMDLNSQKSEQVVLVNKMKEKLHRFLEPLLKENVKLIESISNLLEENKRIKDHYEDILKTNEKSWLVQMKTESCKLIAKYEEKIKEIEQKRSNTITELLDKNEDLLKIMCREKQKYQDKIKRLEDSTEKSENQSIKTIEELQETICTLKTEHNYSMTQVTEEKEKLERSVNQYQEELVMLEKERARILEDHTIQLQEFKDKYKKMNDKLRTECKKQEKLVQEKKITENILQEEHKKEIEKLEEKNQKLEEKNQKEIDELRNTASKNKNSMETLQENYDQEIHSLRQQMDAMKEENLIIESLLSEINNQTKNHLHTKANEHYEQQIQQLQGNIDHLNEELYKREEKVRELDSEVISLRDCVRRECEERYELTEALSKARTRLLSLERFVDPHIIVSRKNMIPSPPKTNRKSNSTPTSSQSGENISLPFL